MNSLVDYLNRVDGKSFKKQDKELNAIWEKEKAKMTKEEFMLQFFNCMLQVGGDDFANYFDKYGAILTRFGIDDEVALIKHLENICISNPTRFVHLMSVLESQSALLPGQVRKWRDVRVDQMERNVLRVEKVELLNAYTREEKKRQGVR